MTNADFAQPEVTLYTDGAASGNPGPGGYGAVLLCGEHRKELSGGFRRTTNNRMEILAAVAGLEALRTPCRVIVYTDSAYLRNAIEEGWARRWRANGWKLNKREPARNADLFQRLLDLCDRHDVTFRWVRGHAGNKENERCDALAVAASRGNDLPADEGFENPPVLTTPSLFGD